MLHGDPRAGVSLLGDAPRCPGTAPEENRYIGGTVLQVQAENYFNGRFVNKFKTGVLAGQVWEDPDTQDIIGYVLVTQDHNVTADYPTTGERVGPRHRAGVQARGRCAWRSRDRSSSAR